MLFYMFNQNILFKIKQLRNFILENIKYIKNNAYVCRIKINYCA